MQVWPNFCSACGLGLRRDDKFCSNCGAPVQQRLFESAAPMVDPGAREEAAENQAAQQEPAHESAAEAPLAAEAPPSAEILQTAEPPRLEEKADLPAAFSPIPTAYDYVAPPPTAYDYVAPEVVKRTRRKSRPPALEILVIILLVLGAGAAVWMLRSSLPAKRAAVVTSNVEVTLSPATARVATGHSVDFAATVSGTDDVEVDWTVQEGDGGGQVVPRGAKATGGAVSSLAVYTAPNSPGTYHLQVTSRADSQKSAEAEITVKKGK